MKKLKLDLDALKVDTFETTVGRQHGLSGTVVGHDETGPSDCETCQPNTYNCNSEWGTCGQLITTDPYQPDTCDQNLCNPTFPTRSPCCWSTADPETCQCSNLATGPCLCP
jgi:hypothetical protein